MAWTSIANRLNLPQDDANAIPLVLAGPILRKTTKNEVSVWIALKHQAAITFNIYEKDGYIPGSSPMATHIGSTIQLGEFLHVALLTIDGLNLTENTIYHYNLFFDNVQSNISPNPWIDSSSLETTNLDSLNVLKIGTANLDDNIISYPTNYLPSFVIPPSDLNILKVVHGSCRKSHGGQSAKSPDALGALDQMLFISNNDADDRPHQLVLTGDQIYSDDVPEVLLFLLEDAAQSLLGWTEEFNIPELLNTDIDRNNLISQEAFRLNAISNSNFTSRFGEYGHYHLMRLGEFYCNYLFCWSDALWGSELPTFQQVRPGQPMTKTVKRLLVFNKEVKLAPYKKFLKTKAHVDTFLESLPAVRRGLANIPTYMMFDDHEVTDDWFLNLRWCNETLGISGTSFSGNPVARRIMQNGLSAFAVFQAWGNNPDHFKPQKPGENLLSSLQQINNESGTNQATWLSNSNIVLPKLVELSAEDSNRLKYRLKDGFEWRFKIIFEKHQLIGMNTRTRRGFRKIETQDYPAALLSTQELQDLFAEVDSENPNQAYSEPLVTFLLSPPPVLGNTRAEAGQRVFIASQNNSRRKDDTLETGESKWDAEPWKFNYPAYNDLFLELAKLKYVIILSGDVHTATSGLVKFWDERNPADVKRAIIAQFTASAAKNNHQGWKVKSLGLYTGEKHVLGWQNPGLNLRATQTYYHEGEEGEFEYDINHAYGPAAFEGEYVEIYTPPSSQMIYQFLYDDRKRSERGTIEDDLIYTPAALEHVTASITHQKRKRYGNYRKIVSKNNIGLVKLNWSPTEKKVFHSLWYHTGRENPESNDLGVLLKDLFFPYTRHTVEDFNIPNDNEKPYNP